MIQAKQELLQALEAVLAQMAPGAGVPSAFESPKVAAHGDLAITAAMPLARSLKKNPRELAQQLVEQLSAQPAATRWVQAFEIAGPGFVNLRLAPAAKQAIVARSAAGRRRVRPPAGPCAARAGGIRVRQPHRPLACGPCAPGRAGRLHLQPVRGAGPRGDARVLLQRCRRADRHAGAVHAMPAQGPEARRCRLARERLQRRLHRRHRCRLPRARHRQGRRPGVHGLWRRGQPGRHPPVRGGLPAPRAGPGPAGLRRALRPLLPRIRAVHQRPRRCHGEAPGRRRQDLREGRRAVAAQHRLRRRQGPRDAQVGRRLHLLRARRGLPHRQVRARLCQGHQRAGQRPPRHHRTRACRAAGRRTWAFRRVSRTTCCTRW